MVRSGSTCPLTSPTQFHALHFFSVYILTIDIPNFNAESDDGGTFMVYNRWGRVGVKGQDKLHGPYMSQDSAIHEFEQKFYDKTKNAWSDRKDFICHPRSYTWLEMDYNESEKEADVHLSFSKFILGNYIILHSMCLIFTVYFSLIRCHFY